MIVLELAAALFLAPCAPPNAGAIPIAKALAEEPPSYSGTVAALLDRHCVVCHRPDQSAPFRLDDYEGARSHAQQIARVTSQRTMPPWLPAPGLGFSGERRLTEEEIATLERWAAAGAPEGDPAVRPPPPRFESGWHHGPPDLVVEPREAFVVPADGEDVFRNLVIELPLAQARHVAAVELRPGNPRVVHHAVLFVDPFRQTRVRDAADPEPGFGGMDIGEAKSPDGHFVGWTPGRVPLPRDEERAWTLPAGADLLIQLHLVPTGKPEPVKPQVGLYFGANPPTKLPYLLRIGSKSMDIPAGEAAYAVADSFRLPIDVTLLSIYPHAHFLGKSMAGEARLPDGTVRRLLEIPDWDFAWQDEYRYAEPIELPAGSELSMRYVFDNSAGNPRNPSQPPVRVTFGARSRDEMADLWLQVLPRDPAQRPQLDHEFQKHDFRQHLASLELALRNAPESAVAHHDLGLALHLAGRHEEAIAALRRALELDPALSSAHNNLGIVLVEVGRADEAVASFEAAVRSDPANPHARNSLGIVLRDRGEHARAAAEFRRALELDPTHAAAQRGLGGALIALGRFRDAEAPLRAALARQPDWLDAELDLGFVLEATKRAGEACGCYRRVLARKKEPRAAERLAWILATHPDPARREPEQALQWARNLLTVATDSSRPRALEVLAAAQAATGRFPAATASLEKALALVQAAGNARAVAAFEQRLAKYRAGEAWLDEGLAEH